MSSIIKPIPSAPGYYATRTGEIVSRKRWHGTVSTKVTPYRSSGKRYLEVRLFVDGVRVARRVHRLVAEAFHGPCPDGLQVRHLDGCATNCRPDNLAYGSPAANAADRVRHGTVAVGSRNGAARLTEDDVREIRERYGRDGVTYARLADEFGVTPSTVRRVATRQLWACVA